MFHDINAERHFLKTTFSRLIEQFPQILIFRKHEYSVGIVLQLS